MRIQRYGGQTRSARDQAPNQGGEHAHPAHGEGFEPQQSASRRIFPDAREASPTANGDRSLIRALGLKIGKIVIDPGHGGHDTGTIGANGLEEKDLVLDVARRLGKLLHPPVGRGGGLYPQRRYLHSAGNSYLQLPTRSRPICSFPSMPTPAAILMHGE